MDGLMGFPPASRSDMFVFGCNETAGGTVTTTPHAFTFPPGASMAFMVAIGAGSGGGGGFSGASSSGRSGGGGGSSGGVASLLIPTLWLPRTVYIFVPPGGAGGAAVTAGTAGLNSRIAWQPGNASANGPSLPASNILVSGSAYSTTWGGPAGAIGGGLGGASGNAYTPLAVGALGLMGIYNSAIISGGAGGGSSNGVSITPLSTAMVSGGAGGGGAPGGGNGFSGGAILPAGYFPPIAGVATAVPGGGGAGSGVAGDGGAGYNTTTPFLLCGGAGGGGSGSLTGGNGGRGGIGCGGGGGGAGVTGGRGGDGGPGLVIIWCW